MTSHSNTYPGRKAQLRRTRSKHSGKINMGDWPWASIIGREIMIIALLFAVAGASLASLIWWLA